MPRSNRTSDVLKEVADERHRQLQKWGEQDHNPTVWCVILAEEFGEVAKEVADSMHTKFDRDHYRRELIQVAAVAVAAVENLSV